SQKTVDVDQCWGIEPTLLIQFGAIVSDGPKPFTEKELVYILSKKYQHHETNIMEILSGVRGKHASQSDLIIFNNQVSQICKQIQNGG
ncbi:MAG: hypothetical protein ACW98X_26020, partial [Promethearchaeota archaeon]